MNWYNETHKNIKLFLAERMTVSRQCALEGEINKLFSLPDWQKATLRKIKVLIKKIHCVIHSQGIWYESVTTHEGWA